MLTSHSRKELRLSAVIAGFRPRAGPVSACAQGPPLSFRNRDRGRGWRFISRFSSGPRRERSTRFSSVIRSHRAGNGSKKTGSVLRPAECGQLRHRRYDRTEHVLWRIRRTVSSPESSSGGGCPHDRTNNASEKRSRRHVLGITEIVSELRSRSLRASALAGSLSKRREACKQTQQKLKSVNDKIARLDDAAAVHYLDIGKGISRSRRDDF